MATTHQKLEALLDAVLNMPEAAQNAAIEALSEITAAPFEISDEEKAILEPALARARRSEFADERDVAAVLDRVWSKTKP